jgi:putative membrane protein
MIRKKMLAIGMAAAFVMTAGAAQAQTSEPMAPSQPKTSDAMKSPQAKAPSQADQKFVTEVIQGDMIEVKLGQLAQQKGQSQAVKQFGQTLVNDHSANQQKAEQLAQSMGVTPPKQISAKAQAIYDKLSKLSDTDFDKQFAQAMVQDHRKDIVEFLKESRKSGETGNFAQQTLPTLRKHMQMARQLMQETTGSRR